MAARFLFFLYQHKKSYDSTQLYRDLDSRGLLPVSVQRLTWTPRLIGIPVDDNIFHVPVHAEKRTGRYRCARGIYALAL